MTSPDIVVTMDGSDPRPVLVGRLRRRELIALDALVAVAYVLVLLPWPDPARWPAWAAIAGIALAVAVRRVWPVPAFVVALGLSAPAGYLGVIADPLLATAYVLYPVALAAPAPRWEPTIAIGAVSVVCLGFAVVAGSADGTAQSAGSLLAGAAAMGMAWTVGRLVRDRRAHAIWSAEQAAARAVTDERLRIARELHDVVAHSIGVIAVKAGVANHLVRTRPDETHDALRVIESASRDALVEMRRMLGVLRTGSTAPDDLSPAPGMDRLTDLTERAAAAGVEVDLRVRAAQRLPEALGTTVYRIVQEALTNVVKHAAPTRCRVEVTVDADEVRVEVTDHGGPGRRSAPAKAGGHGLVGMRERVLLYGGTLACGPRRGGGYTVSARLPLAPANGGPP